MMSCNFGFFRVACASPALSVCDTDFNSEKIIDYAREASENGANLVVFPELCITGYTSGDLFLQTSLQSAAIKSLEYIAKKTQALQTLIVAGLPLAVEGALYNSAAVLFKGKVIALVPKTFIPNYSEFYEKRWFSPASKNLPKNVYLSEKNPSVPFGTNILISDSCDSSFTLGIELCEDLWVPLPPSVSAALNGATVIANLSGSNEIIGKADYRRNLVKMQSAHTISAYLYANAGHDESTQDLVFSGHSLISENGTILAESELFKNGIIYADIDLERILKERQKTTTFNQCAETLKNESNFGSESNNLYRKIYVELKTKDFRLGKKNELKRFIDPHPFVPSAKDEREKRCKEVATLQAEGLAKRLRHINAKSAVIGLSGGLDSTLAFLVTVRAFDLCKIDRSGLRAVTMPCFGTTDRTYNNACTLAKKCGATLLEIPIANSVREHFKDIGQDENVHDVTYENSQARERTQVLMDIANKTNGIVIGTGDLSELALGWCTYNGDQMSMYGVNSSIPKTLVRYLVEWFSESTEVLSNSNKDANESDAELSAVLKDILETPVSPELLPPSENGEIAQKTEDLVGPYELHDFYLYYLLRFGFSPKKILFLADCSSLPYNHAFKLKWLRTFYKRFFSQQFKRSCMPDGAKVGTVNLSPRGDFRMPSDASVNVWLKEIDEIE